MGLEKPADGHFELEPQHLLDDVVFVACDDDLVFGAVGSDVRRAVVYFQKEPLQGEPSQIQSLNDLPQ